MPSKFSDDSLDSFRFARGFLLTKGLAPNVPKGWPTQSLGDWSLSHDPRVSVTLVNDVNSTTVIVGEAHSPNDDANVLQTAERLHNTSGPEFQAIADGIVGRYVIIRLGTESSIQQDAAGLRSVFFGQNEPIAGSHPLLVAQQIGEAPSQFTRAYLAANGLSCMPGRKTEYRDVSALTPNTKLLLGSQETVRIFHGKLDREICSADAASELISVSQGQLKWLSSHSPVISLSAGLDSRTTLALLRPIRNSLDSFTYDLGLGEKNKYARYDVEIAEKIANIASIPFRVIDISNRIIDEELKKIMINNFHKTHSRSLAQKYIETIDCKTNIRSNVYGIGRASYNARNIPLRNGTDMTRLAFGSKINDPRAIKAFNEFIDETEFPFESDVDARDLFLWEHRIGVWQSAIYLESDLSHRSHVLVNQRNILRTLLSVPLADRINGEVQKNSITRSWPELTALPVNGELF